MNICFKMKEILDINTPWSFQRIIRKIKKLILHLYSRTCLCYHYRIAKIDEILPNRQNALHRVWNILDTVFVIIHVERKMQIQLLIKQKETLPHGYQPPVTQSQNSAEKTLSISPWKYNRKRYKTVLHFWNFYLFEQFFLFIY